MKSISCQKGGGEKIDKRNVIFAFESWKALVAKRGGENFDKGNVVFAFESLKTLAQEGRIFLKWVLYLYPMFDCISCQERAGKFDNRNVILVSEP